MSLHHINEQFGPDALGHGLFYSHGPALRFELAGGDVAVDRFSQAYDRARQIAQVACSGSETLTVVLACYHVDGNEPAALLRSARSCGVDIPAVRDRGTRPPEAASDAPARSMVAFEAKPEVIPRLLWGAVAQGLGIRPRLLGDLYLADPTRGVLLHPYDDRGMDVVGPGTDVLAELYSGFAGWLLDYDLERMQAFFTGT